MPVTTVEWLFPDGEGGAPAPGGGVLRLPGALPGDRVRWREVGRRGTTVQGEIEAVEEASPSRRPAPCPWDAACGGCDLAGFVPEARRDALLNVAMRAFGLDAPPEWVPSPRTTAHRARVRLAIADGKLGYRPERSHDLVEIGSCGIAREEIQEALARLRALGLALEGLGHVELRSDGSRVVYAFESSPGGTPGPTGKGGVPRAVRDGLAALGDVALDGRALHGDPVLWLPSLDGLRLRASPKSFYQVNLEVNALLVQHVRDAVLAMKAERVADLYAGIGNLSLPIAARAVPVVAVELVGQATADLRASAEAAALKNVRAVEVAAEKFDPSREAFDVAVLDPPRAGAPGVVAKLVRQRPRGLVYVSCFAPSGARDLQEARKAGYRITSVRCFEMFPDTHHFETVVTMVR
jgi:23S rRNA (uracil1939-C5)-methyltransferase